MVAYRRLLLTPVTALGAAALVACGGATVTSDDVSSQAPVTSEAQPSESAAKEDSADTETSEDSAESEAADRPEARDQAAREIDEVPSQEQHFSKQDQGYLDAIANANVRVDGVEDQLIGTGLTLCSDGAIASATAGAVAGQLIEQGRSDMDPKELTALIEDSARQNYCG